MNNVPTSPAVTPDVPQPESESLWRWRDGDGDDFTIDANSLDPGAAAFVSTPDNGTWMSAEQCREAAAVLIALAERAKDAQ